MNVEINFKRSCLDPFLQDLVRIQRKEKQRAVANFSNRSTAKGKYYTTQRISETLCSTPAYSSSTKPPHGSREEGVLENLKLETVG